MQREYTATCYILKDEKLLLVYHHKFGKWMPPGGHVEPNETPQEAACRECLEETGLVVRLISESLTINYPNAKTLARPFMCLLEEIPNPPHQHIDMIFLAEVIGGMQNEHAKWFSEDELEHVDTFTEVRDIVKALWVRT